MQRDAVAHQMRNPDMIHPEASRKDGKDHAANELNDLSRASAAGNRTETGPVCFP